MNANQKGFSVVEILIVLAVVGLIGGAGWYVWHSRASKDTSSTTSPSTSTTTKPNTVESTPSNLSKYDDDYVSFSYPSDWKVEKQYTFTDDYGAYSLNMTAPVDSSLKASDPASTKLYLHTSILIAKNNRFGAAGMTCREDCTVYHLDKVSPKSPSSTGSLVVSDWDSQGYPSTVEYTRSDVSEGTKTYALGLAVNSNYYARIYGSYMSGDSSDIKLATNTDFQNSTSYKQLKELVATLTFKTSKLPQ
jgi:prepilin-type N-terminal cleavage/methylation domain-containing protein